MKPIFLFGAAVLAANVAAAQRPAQPRAVTSSTLEARLQLLSGPASVGGGAKVSGVTDTLFYTNDAPDQFDSSVSYIYDATFPADSGRLFGMNVVGDKGFAELYDFIGTGDTTMHVLGTISLWGGRAQTSSTRQVNIKLWKRDATKRAIPSRPTKWFLTGYPQATAVSTKSRAVTDLNLTTGNLVTTYFSAPITGINYDFFVGYDIAYTWGSSGGDTVGLDCSKLGDGVDFYTGTVEATSGDTLVAPRTVIQSAAGQWQSAFWERGLQTNLSIAPLIRFSSVDISAGVPVLRRNSLTFYTAFPNPASADLIVKFAVDQPTDVTVRLLDVTGKLLKIQTIANPTPGEHAVHFPIGDLAAGTYLYHVSTAGGDAAAAQFTVAR